MNISRSQIVRDLKCYWRTLVVVGAPIVFLPIILSIGSRKGNCLYVILIMAAYWMTEAIPLPITALMPIFLYPMFGILGARDVAVQYLTDSNFVFFGSMMMALALEESGLQERIALRILLLMGSNPRWIMLGFELGTAFLSMWMSNTATTAMMVPIALAVIQELHTFNKPSNKKMNDNGTVVSTVENIEMGKIEMEVDKIEEDASNDTEKPTGDDGDHGVASDDLLNAPDEEKKLYKGILLSICYAANIGGTGTLTGTGSNIVLSGQLAKLWPKQDSLSFATWMAFALPQMLILLLLNWLWLQLLFVGFKKVKENEEIKSVIKSKYDALGRMRFHEMITFAFFLLLVILWLFADPKVFPGWGSFFPKGYMTDGATAMCIGCLLFIFPRDKPDWLCFSSRDPKQPPKISESLLTWKAMQHKFSWSIVLLLGGAYAMAAGVKSSGLSDWIGHGLEGVSDWPMVAFILLIIVSICFLTEFSSNVATASIFIPIVNSVVSCTYSHAVSVGANPLYFLLPIALSCSFAFMLPVATPPNAIVFSARLLRVKDMVMAGFGMNWICIIVTLINIETWGMFLFNFNEVPDWALAVNQTTGFPG